MCLYLRSLLLVFTLLVVGSCSWSIMEKKKELSKVNGAGTRKLYETVIGNTTQFGYLCHSWGTIFLDGSIRMKNLSTAFWSTSCILVQLNLLSFSTRCIILLWCYNSSAKIVGWYLFFKWNTSYVKRFCDNYYATVSLCLRNRPSSIEPDFLNLKVLICYITKSKMQMPF